MGRRRREPMRRTRSDYVSRMKDPFREMYTKEGTRLHDELLVVAPQSSCYAHYLDCQYAYVAQVSRISSPIQTAAMKRCKHSHPVPHPLETAPGCPGSLSQALFARRPLILGS